MSEGMLLQTVESFVEELRTVPLSVDSLPECNSDFNAATFWLHLYVESQKLAREATKLSLVYSSPPLPPPDEVLPLVSQLISCYSALTSCYRSLPRQLGEHLTKAVSSYLVSVTSSLSLFLDDFSKALKECRGHSELVPVGALLEECKEVCNLPNDNLQAVKASLKADEELMIDTVDEITSELKNQMNMRRSGKQGVVPASDFEEVWSEAEFNLVSQGLKLAKLGRAITQFSLKTLDKKGKGDAISSEGLPGPGLDLEPEQTSQLDKMASHSSQLSPQLDDLSAYIYPPVDTDSLPPLVEGFVGSLNGIIDCLETGWLSEGRTTSDEEYLTNIKTELERTRVKLSSLLVSNEIIDSVSHLSLT